MAIYYRLHRISDSIQEIIMKLLQSEIRDPRLKYAVITGVKVSKGLKSANIFFYVFNIEVKINDILRRFNSACGFFRTQIAKKLYLRTVPILRFIPDKSIDYGNKMDKLIYKARAEDIRIMKNIM